MYTKRMIAMLERPGRLNGLRHIALLVPNLEACERFYVDILGMQVLHRANEGLPDLRQRQPLPGPCLCR
jgi:hypothetical protein